MQKILLLTQEARNGEKKEKRLCWDGKKQVRLVVKKRVQFGGSRSDKKGSTPERVNLEDGAVLASNLIKRNNKKIKRKAELL